MPIGQVSDIDIRLLRVFKCVVESGGFSAAEGRLNVTRAAISLRMGELEDRVGMRLCERGRSGFHLTDEGQIVYEATLKLFRELDTFRAKVNGASSELRGELNFGITDNLVTSPHMRMTKALDALREMGPAIQFNVRMTTPEEVERGIIEGRFHIGAVPDFKRLASFESFPLYGEEQRLYCGALHSLASIIDEEELLQSLPEFEMVEMERGVRPAIPDLPAFTKVSAKAQDREGIAFLILSNKYIGFLPVHYANRWVAANQMKALAPTRLEYTIDYRIIARRSAQPHQLTKIFLDELAKVPLALPDSAALL